ncbi:hypothetical protein CMT41_02240 [Colwellia sp. MT41]|nr:hypothetical protein CMT41_02240 [Colwellia sp. MT41]
MWLVKSISDDFSIFLFCYFFVLLVLYKNITQKLTISFFNILSYYLIALLLIDSFNISRMILGVFILFFSVVALADNKYLKAIFLIVIATSIQLVCAWGVVFIIYKYTYEKIKNKKVFYTLYLSSLGVSYLLVELFKFILVSIEYGHYVVDESGTVSFLNYIYAMILIMFFYFTKSKFEIKNKITLQIFYLLPTIFYIVPLYSAIPIAYRFNYIYILFFIFIIPDMLNICISKIKSGQWGFLGFLIVVLIYIFMKVFNFFTRDIYAALEWSMVYDFVFWRL